MGATLPELSQAAFRAGVARLAPRPLSARCLDDLWLHYRELARWNPRLSLIGPGTRNEVLSRHYGESLCALRLVELAQPEPGQPASQLESGQLESSPPASQLESGQLESSGRESAPAAAKRSPVAKFPVERSHRPGSDSPAEGPNRAERDPTRRARQRFEHDAEVSGADLSRSEKLDRPRTVNSAEGPVGPGRDPTRRARQRFERWPDRSLGSPDDRPRDDRPFEIVDIGSGGGFPGLVLAAALAGLGVPVRLTLVEARERKWAFLSAVARKVSFPASALNARVAWPLSEELTRGLPERIDLLTTRAVRLPAAALTGLSERLTNRSRALLWTGAETPEPPSGWFPGRTLRLEGSAHRRIVELTRQSSRAT